MTSRPEARVQLPFDSLGLPKEPQAVESAQNARTHSGRPLPLRTDGRTHQQRSIRPTIGTLWPSTDSPELWNPRDLRGTVLGTRGVRKEKGQRQHRL